MFFISGFKRDAFNVFSGEENYLQKSDRCKVVNSWKEIRPSVPGSQLIIIQASHGQPGGVSECDDGDEQPEEILNSIRNLSRTNQLGVFLQSCYSGDLMRRFLIENLKVQKNTCLITNSVINKIAMAGTNVGVFKELMDLGPEKSLNDFFIETMKQGMISSADWERTKLIDLSSEGRINRKIINHIQQFMKIDDSMQCSEIASSETNQLAVSLPFRMLCAGLKIDDIHRIQQNFIEHELPQIGEDVSFYPGDTIGVDAYLASSDVNANLLEIDYFKNHPDLNKAINHCETFKQKNTCILNFLLPRNCRKKLKKSRELIIDFLLGQNFKVRNKDFDPASFIHHLNKQTLIDGNKFRSRSDTFRHRACDNFKVNAG
jgi:hypothetical protein